MSNQKKDEDLINTLKNMGLFDYDFNKTDLSELKFEEMMEQTIKFLKIFDEHVDKLKNYNKQATKYSSVFLALRLQKKRGIAIKEAVLLNPKKEDPRPYINKLANYKDIALKRSVIKSEINSHADDSPFRKKAEALSPLIGKLELLFLKPTEEKLFSERKDLMNETNLSEIKDIKYLYETSKRGSARHISQRYISGSKNYDSNIELLTNNSQSTFQFHTAMSVDRRSLEEPALYEFEEPTPLAEKQFNKAQELDQVIKSRITENLEEYAIDYGLNYYQEDGTQKLSGSINETYFDNKQIEQVSYMLSHDLEQENEYNVEISSRQNYEVENDQIVGQIDENIIVVVPSSEVKNEIVVLEKNVIGSKKIAEELSINQNEKLVDVGVMDIEISNEKTRKKLRFNEEPIMKYSQTYSENESSQKPDNYARALSVTQENNSTQKIPKLDMYFEEVDNNLCLISKYSIALKMSEQSKKANLSVEDVLSKENEYSKPCMLN